MQHDLERRLRRLHPHGRRQVAVQHRRVQRHHRRGGIGDRGRIGGIGIHQHLRLLAAVDPAREVGRNVQHEQHVAARQRLFGRVLAWRIGWMSK